MSIDVALRVGGGGYHPIKLSRYEQGKSPSVIAESERIVTEELDAARRHAIAITESLLYIKQHSINCVAAAMYAMTRFDTPLFPPEEARCFVDALFATPDKDGRPLETRPDATERAAIQRRVWLLYQRFVEAGTTAATWEEPLLAFLRESPRKAAAL